MCRPFHRRIICTRNFARRAIATVLVLAAVVSVHKPLLSGVYDVTATDDPDGSAATSQTPALSLSFAAAESSTSREISARRRDLVESWATSSDNAAAAMMMTSSDQRRVCGRNPDYSWTSSFITEIVYGLSITVVPFVPISRKRKFPAMTSRIPDDVTPGKGVSVCADHGVERGDTASTCRSRPTRGQCNTGGSVVVGGRGQWQQGEVQDGGEAGASRIHRDTAGHLRLGALPQSAVLRRLVSPVSAEQVCTPTPISK